MKITEKHKLKDMAEIAILLECSETDLLTECAKYPFTGKIRGIVPKSFDDMTMREQVWLWDIKQTTELLSAICQIFFNIPEKNVEKWLLKCPLIDFYSFVDSVNKRSIAHADLFSNLKVDLTEEEKKAGYGETTKSGAKTMVMEMSERRQITIDEAWDLKVIEYYLVFEHATEAANRQRRLNKIYNEKK